MATSVKRNKSSEVECANNHSTRSHASLSGDIIFEILLRIPARDVVPLKRVCKLWYNLISCPEFAKAHLCYWKSTSQIIVGGWHNDYHYLDTRTMEIHPLTLKKFLNTSVFVYDSLDGLILFQAENKVYICNPVTRRIRLLLRTPASWSFGEDYYKLVFDAQQQKYKMMGFCYRFVKHTSEKMFHTIEKKFITLTILGDEQGPMPHWRDLRKPVWREVGTSFWHYLASRFTPVTINGVLHWIGFTDGKQEGTKLASVQSLDIGNEKFKERIELPCQPAPSCIQRCNCKLLEVKGSLFVTIPISAVEIDIWILNDWDKHIWLKQHKICFESMRGKPSELHGFFKDEFEAMLIIDWDNNLRNFFLEMYRDRYFLYHLQSQKLTLVKTSCVPRPYVHTLVGWD